MDATTIPTADEAIEMFKDMVNMETDPDESVLPMLLWGSPDGPVMMALAMDMGNQGTARFLHRIIEGTIPRMGWPNWLVFCSEAYQESVAIEDVPDYPGLKPGELQARHNAGEAIQEIAMVYGSDGTTEYGKFAPFKRTGTAVEWGADTDDPHHTTGGIPSLFRAVFAARPTTETKEA